VPFIAVFDRIPSGLYALIVLAAPQPVMQSVRFEFTSLAEGILDVVASFK
jgi:hypothetical protein